jgi:hypothetical protein
MTRLVLCSSVLIGSAGGLIAASFLEPGASAAVPSSARSDDPILSPEEESVASLMAPDDAARYRLQKGLQQQAELAALLTQIQQARHDAAMSVINNIR